MHALYLDFYSSEDDKTHEVDKIKLAGKFTIEKVHNYTRTFRQSLLNNLICCSQKCHERVFCSLGRKWLSTN